MLETISYPFLASILFWRGLRLYLWLSKRVLVFRSSRPWLHTLTSVAALLPITMYLLKLFQSEEGFRGPLPYLAFLGLILVFRLGGYLHEWASGGTHIQVMGAEAKKIRSVMTPLIKHLDPHAAREGKGWDCPGWPVKITLLGEGQEISIKGEAAGEYREAILPFVLDEAEALAPDKVGLPGVLQGFETWTFIVPVLLMVAAVAMLLLAFIEI